MIPKQFSAAFRVYEALWGAALPFLGLNGRVKEGFNHRRSPDQLPPADLWIQAASAGESYLAWSLLETLDPARPIQVLITTNTRQGLDILERAVTAAESPSVTATAGYFPFDRPSIMDSAVNRVRPRLMVLLETEIWPGLLGALKKRGIPTLVANGRLTPRSLRRYRFWPSLWKCLGPDRVLAISHDDAGRFADLFGKDRVTTMPNIKFDRLSTTRTPASGNPLEKWIPVDKPFLVLGSVREPEEEAVGLMMKDIRSRVPETIIGLFPRHMHRISAWQERLTRLALPWRLRSSLGDAPVQENEVILWDAFGELNPAYALATAVFVGGSLAPLGGQNFLEAMIHGVVPVIGPFWDNFTWAGNGVFEQGLATQASDGPAIAELLARRLKGGKPSPAIRDAAVRYIEERKGGAKQTCRVIESFLDS